MTKLATVATITTATATTKKFIFGSGLNVTESKIQASQPKITVPIMDCRITVFEKTSKGGNAYTVTTLYGKNAITGVPVSFELGMGYQAKTHEYALIFDPYLVFMKDDNGQPIGTGFLHCKGFQPCNEDTLQTACLTWQAQQANGTTDNAAADLLR